MKTVVSSMLMARELVRYYAKLRVIENDGEEGVIINVLTDLMHLCARTKGHDFNAMLEHASLHFKEENENIMG